MPLKLNVVGNTLSGRRTQAQRLANKYGLIYIDPYDIIREALLLANPVIIEDKKAGKKEAKKP
jgi:adenylate kinase family enzyme